MRLKKIKLAGFKSFVDPTTLDLRSSLVAVVGPNGCGKSNVIDAVRWVLGESSAKNLRGESMADVIFNGSSNRKPVGQASIELIFDNADGAIGGEFAQYAEVSIRRQATRDGQSSYFLNNTKCRRRDITELFLGTGLGPRSYAIIEQGMITRVIEAKPEDLRAFLEEAAGISLYKKRRQETETRMRHTQENLERLEDLRQELEKQVERLKRQSEAAVKYRQYKEEQDTLEAELATLRWQGFQEQLKMRSQEIRVLTTSLEEKQAGRSHIDLDLEKLRVQKAAQSDVLNNEQARYYDLGAKVARIEQSLEHHRERQKQLSADLEQAELNCQQTDEQWGEDDKRLNHLQSELELLETEFATVQSVLDQEQTILKEAEEALKHWNTGFEVFQQESLQVGSTAEVEKTKIEQLERQSRDVYARLARFNEEKSSFNINILEQELQELEQTLVGRKQEQQSWQEKWAVNQEKIKEVRLQITEDQDVLDDIRSQLQTHSGRQVSLETLQQAALGKTNASVIEWLSGAGIVDSPRLGEGLTVESGYERAVETVLGAALEAVCVSEIDGVAATLGKLSSGNVMLLESLSTNLNFPHKIGRPDWLLSKINSDFTLTSLLQGVYVVSELQEALAFRSQLEEGESIVTREGVWLGRNWLKVYWDQDNHAGVLTRETELKALVEEIKITEKRLKEAENLLDSHEEQLKSFELERESLHQSQQELVRIIQDLSSKISDKRARWEQGKNRIHRLQEDIIGAEQQLSLAQEEISLSRLVLQKALDTMADFSTRREALLKERDKLRDLWNQAEGRTRSAKDTVHAVALQRQTLITQVQAIKEGMARLKQQQEGLLVRRSTLQKELEQLGTSESEAMSLTQLLEQRLSVEKALTEARTALESLDQEYRALEKQRGGLEQEVERLREKLDTLRMDWQALEVRSQTILEKLVSLNVKPESILETLSKDATESDWAQKLEEVAIRIQRLGAINLAAIEEYEAETERKKYLDIQHQDLTEALETLSNAIRKIDKETRARFKETFDKVNSEFQNLFPRLFGGGEAYLELIGEDLLEAGVTVMARPPGKRNSSIHLLSGGEKALTAVSLVFAIFQLNPAPFCMLDEVDAPLDDANVGRFCALVKQMSLNIQFVVITHNKLAMEMAHHLVGVTMKEPGVSRLVSVDVEEAASLVAS